VKQEVLLWKALYKEQEEDYEGSLVLALGALHCTAPDFEGKDMKWRVFQREEIMIVNKIADAYQMLGQTEESKKWYEAVTFSLKKQMDRFGIAHNGLMPFPSDALPPSANTSMEGEPDSSGSVPKPFLHPKGGA